MASFVTGSRKTTACLLALDVRVENNRLAEFDCTDTDVVVLELIRRNMFETREAQPYLSGAIVAVTVDAPARSK